MDSKPWYLSKTLWLNGITAVVSLATTVLQLTNTIDLGENKAIVVTIVGTVISVGNIVLRLLTDKPIEGTK